ncbi:response regulator [uncultured Phascolarctobacterium sp.]|jgi:DNA-binding response OmpR family regulator|uniref:response regulator n=1 Tax=uncultured Phascolarctobacterium sp. TaxID=512296 RepID=UPI0015B0BFFA|nr:response regulator [uncultured Phascolarctobacterium sp.]
MKTVLIVDDNLKNLDLFKDFVESWGYVTITAQQGKDAICFAEQYLPDIILLDVMLPGMSGYEVCRELKENPKTQHIPVVMITVLNDIADRIHGYKIGADQFLVKPVDYNELHAILGSLFGKKSMYDEMESRWTVIESLNILLKQILPPESVIMADRKFHYCRKLCDYLNLSKNETEQGLLLVRIQDIIATLCKQKGSTPEEEMDFLEPLKMEKWAKYLLLYIRNYLSGVDENLQRKIRECHLEKLAGISFVLDRYGSILVSENGDDNKALLKLRQESSQYAYPDDVVRLLEQIVNDELFMKSLKDK